MLPVGKFWSDWQYTSSLNQGTKRNEDANLTVLGLKVFKKGKDLRRWSLFYYALLISEVQTAYVLNWLQSHLGANPITSSLAVLFLFQYTELH